MSKWYRGSYQISQYQRLNYNYSPLHPIFSIPSSSLPLDSQIIKSLASKAEIPVKIPVVNWNSCVGCGICVQNCPVGAIEIIAEKACINPEKCIRCGVCFELCPHNAII